MEKLPGRKDLLPLDLRPEPLAVEKIPQPSGGCNDWRPMWIGDFVYFLSDRNGEFKTSSPSIQTRKKSNS